MSRALLGSAFLTSQGWRVRGIAKPLLSRQGCQRRNEKAGADSAHPAMSPIQKAGLPRFPLSGTV